MANIGLGQTISASISTTDPISVDGLRYYDEYDLPSLAGFSQLDIKLDAASQLLNPKIELINAATGATVAQSYTQDTSLRPLLLAQSTLPGVNYKLRVSGGTTTAVTDKGVGNYQLSVTDGGKGTSIVSPSTSRSDTNSVIGTVGRSGAFFSLGGIGGGISSSLALFDVAKTPNGQFYGFAGGGLYRIDPSLDLEQQIKQLDPIRDANGNNIGSYTLESSADGKLYAIGLSGAGVKLYQIDVTNNQPVATSLGTLPAGFLNTGDLVFDAANNRFLATNFETAQTDALWQIPLSNPAGASKIGSIGAQKVYGLSFENGQLFGYTGGLVSYVATQKNEFNRIKIDVASGKGTVDGAITGVGEALSISGAATIVGGGTPVISVTPVNSPFPTSAVDAIGTKNQSLTSRTLDLTDYVGKTLKVDAVSKGDAAYTNNIGFYAVQDSIGTIKLGNGSTLKPGDANYAVEAIKSAVLRAGKIDSKSNQDIAGGGIYAPVVVAQGTLDDFVSKNPTNGGDGKAIHAYFNYIGANTDKFDHFRLTAPNTFAVEDVYGGGDKDFNDLVVNMNVKTV
jgi:Domain of unknown function (DUF4114)